MVHPLRGRADNISLWITGKCGPRIRKDAYAFHLPSEGCFVTFRCASEDGKVLPYMPAARRYWIRSFRFHQARSNTHPGWRQPLPYRSALLKSWSWRSPVDIRVIAFSTDTGCRKRKSSLGWTNHLMQRHSHQSNDKSAIRKSSIEYPASSIWHPEALHTGNLSYASLASVLLLGYTLRHALIKSGRRLTSFRRRQIIRNVPNRMSAGRRSPQSPQQTKD